MGLFSCQNSHWSTVAIFTKGHNERGRLILRSLPLCYVTHSLYFCSWYQKNYFRTSLIGM